IFSENYTEQVKHGSRKCTKRVSWNTRYLNLVEKNLTHTKSAAIFPLRRIMVKWGKEYERIFSIFPGGFGFEKIDFN
ncbi:hypothetical protein, partial [Heyndrickxia coagulans]